jgi:hypothetical protein
MKTSLITTENVDFLDDMFPQFRPQLSKVEFVGTVSVFSFFFESENDLNEKWKTITNAIAAYYQSAFEGKESEFERWNIYILFLVKEAVDNRLKTKIENDKFSSRKIVQDTVSDTYHNELIHQLIKEYIIIDDISRSTSENQPSVDRATGYSSDSEIFRIIENSELQVTGRRMHKRDIEPLYQKIILSLNMNKT